MSACGRCKKEIVALERLPDSCWWCNADLCDPCWEEVGHCGHEEAEAINEAGRKVEQP